MKLKMIVGFSLCPHYAEGTHIGATVWYSHTFGHIVPNAEKKLLLKKESFNNATTNQ